MSKYRIIRRSLFGFVALVLVLTAVGAIVGMSSGCNDAEKCLAYGENCAVSYKLANYGTTDIQCCQGSCMEGVNNGYLVCRN